MTSFKIAEIEIIYKRNTLDIERPFIKSSKDAYHLLHAQWDSNKIELIEQAKILLLDTSLKVLGISDISTGGITGTVVDPRIAFVTALKSNATQIILAHNHPSGNTKPSYADEKLTKRMQEIGKLLEINVADHLIIGNQGYYSFSDGLEYERESNPTIDYLSAKMPF